MSRAAPRPHRARGGGTAAVLIDSFGTLVRMDEPGPHLRAELALRGVEVSEEDAARAFGAEIAYYLEHHVEGHDVRSLSELRDRCAHVLRDSLELPELELETVREAMLASIRFAPYPDAVPALTALRSRGLRLVVASNWDCSLREVLARVGLFSRVDAVVTSAQAGAAKPQRRFFAAALRAARTAAREAVYVGDSPEQDAAGATAAGVAAVLVRRAGEGGSPDVRRADEGNASCAPVISRLTDLPSVI